MLKLKVMGMNAAMGYTFSVSGIMCITWRVALDVLTANINSCNSERV